MKKKIILSGIFVVCFLCISVVNSTFFTTEKNQLNSGLTLKALACIVTSSVTENTDGSTSHHVYSGDNFLARFCDALWAPKIIICNYAGQTTVTISNTQGGNDITLGVEVNGATGEITSTLPEITVTATMQASVSIDCVGGNDADCVSKPCS